MTVKGIRRKLHGEVKRMNKANGAYNRAKRNVRGLQKMLKKAERDER